MIRKAVIPVAGLGSRLLPLTKAVPKEMLPVGDKPVLEHTVRELASSGIEEIYIVTSTRKMMIESHFAPDLDLERQLIEAGKEDLAARVRNVSTLANISYLHQDGPYGNGTPILNAARMLGGEPFMVLWADDIFVSDVPRALQLKDAFERVNAPILALMPVRREDAPRYGVPVVKEDLGGGLLLTSGLVEKPPLSEVPSDYAAIGGYVVTSDVVAELENQTRSWHRHRSGEIYLSAALNAVAETKALYGQVIGGTWFDTGSPMGYLRAQFVVALADPVFGPELRRLAAVGVEGY